MEPLKVIDPHLLSLTKAQLVILLPFLWVFGGCLLTLVIALFRSFNPKWFLFVTAIATLTGSALSAWIYLGTDGVSLFSGMLRVDAFSTFFNLLFVLAAGLTLAFSLQYLDRERLQYPEYTVLVLFSTLGMMILSSASELIVLFIGLEIMSLAAYVLVGFRRADRRSNEAAMKYFILGSAASAVLLYGAALIYGSTGSTVMSEISIVLHAHPAVATPVFYIGTWMVIVGFLFKVAAVPFHMWMPDVYEGAPTPITGFMTTGIKAASFAAFVRVFGAFGYGSDFTHILSGHLHQILWAVALLTMFIGNVIALTQTNLKRMLADSSIAHTGYLLVAFIAGPVSEGSFSPVLIYLAGYTVMNLGAFGVLTILSGRGDTGLNLADLSGLSRKRPWLSAAMAVFMFSMAGVPPTAGFVAKYYLFYAAIQGHETWLVVLAVLCSSISVYYYLRVLVYIYMRDPVEAAPPPVRSPWAAVAVAICVVMTLQIGINPSRMINAARLFVAGLT